MWGGWKNISGWKIAITILVIFCKPVGAQLQVGNYINMNLVGSVGFGYGGAFGNTQINSAHNLNFIANADLNGYYFHPNFLSFHARPYFDRGQANTDSQNITRSSGFGADVNLFSGSRFP